MPRLGCSVVILSRFWVEQAPALPRERQHGSKVGNGPSNSSRATSMSFPEAIKPVKSATGSRISGCLRPWGSQIATRQRASALRGAPHQGCHLKRFRSFVRGRQDVPIFLDTSLRSWCTAGHGCGCFERPLETSIDSIRPYEII